MIVRDFVFSFLLELQNADTAGVFWQTAETVQKLGLQRKRIQCIFGVRDSVRSSVIWEELGGELMLLHIEKSQLRWLGHLASRGHVPPGGDPGENPGHAGMTMSPSCPGNHLGSSRQSVQGQGILGKINMNWISVATWIFVQIFIEKWPLCNSSAGLSSQYLNLFHCQLFRLWNILICFMTSKQKCSSAWSVLPL